MINRFFSRLGNKTLNFFAELGQFSQLFGQILKYTPQLFKKRKLLLFQMEHIGVNSLPLVIIIAIFTGAVVRLKLAPRLSSSWRWWGTPIYLSARPGRRLYLAVHISG